MEKVDILTYGRLGPEFQNYAEGIPGLSCEYVEEDGLADAIKEYENIAGLALPSEIDISHIKWIHAFSAGVDAWLRRKDLHPDVFITKTRGRMGMKMGEYCLTYILYVLKACVVSAKCQQERKWERGQQRNLFNEEILILGTGGIGSGIAKTLKPLAKKVTGVNFSGRGNEHFDSVIPFSKTSKDLKDFSIVINALPLTSQTEQQVNKDFFERLSDCIYINVGRGETTSTDDLLNALDNGNIFKAILDVFETEPLPQDSTLWSHPDIIITPHQSAVTDIDDVRSSFLPAFEAYKNKENNDYVVIRSRGY